ncbi:MAG: TetR/AcrR family transcriptional regulator [Myxococcaceae bacterium]|nr:TetR/AcrR family transcriptional regulator [Myxococcaceae bacterium]
MDQAKRECIIVAAVKCFARFGFKKASVDEIAKDAGVAKGTVYLAAENKEDLLYQALLHELREWNAQMSKLIDPRRDALEILMDLATRGLESLPQRPLIKQLFEGDMHAMLPRWQDRFDELTRLGRRNTVEVLNLGVKQGRFRGDLDAEETAALLMDLQVSTMLFHNRETPDREERLGRRLVAAIALIERGLTGPVASASSSSASKKSSSRLSP